MLVAGQCLGCGRLVNASNASQVTAQAGKPVYCDKCQDLATAHMTSLGMDKALGALKGLDLTGPVDQALQLLIRRLRGSLESLAALMKGGLFTAHHHDPSTILRSVYDASLQAEYIVHDAAKATDLAQNYLDFQEIERYRLIKALGKYKDEFSGKMVEGEERAANELKIRERFEKVEAKFRKAHGAGYMTSWHDEKLREFCKARGRKEEYDFMLVLLHGAAHSSALAMLRGYSANPSFLMLTAANLTWRAIGGMLDYHKIEMEPELAGVMENARRSLLEANKAARPATEVVMA